MGKKGSHLSILFFNIKEMETKLKKISIFIWISLLKNINIPFHKSWSRLLVTYRQILIISGLKTSLFTSSQIRIIITI